jgi:precorrin-3B synthase
VLGVHALGAASFVGAAVPFGQLQARSLRQLADRAEAHGAAELRLTPWRAALAPGLRIASAGALAAELGDCGFLLDGGDPRLALAACSGRPACASAHADVRSTALFLAPLLAAYKGVLHVSGCRKGCAHNARAPLTFVASPVGYDVVENGLARDEPSARGLSVEAITAYLETHKEGTA